MPTGGSPLSDLETLREIWQFMATAQQELKHNTESLAKLDEKVEALKENLNVRCETCPFANERLDYKKLKESNLKILTIGGVILFIISTFVAPVLVRLIVN